MTLVGALGIFAGLIGWLAIFLFAMTSYNDFRLRLQFQHGGMWVALGRPMFKNEWRGLYMSSANSHWLMQRFLIFRRYRALNDAALTKLGDRALIAYILMYIALSGIAAFGLLNIGHLR